VAQRGKPQIRIKSRPYRPGRARKSHPDLWTAAAPGCARNSPRLADRSRRRATLSIPLTPCHPDRPRATLSLSKGRASGSGRTPAMIPITTPHQGVLSIPPDVPIFLCVLCGKSGFQFRRCLAILALLAIDSPPRARTKSSIPLVILTDHERP